MKWQPSLIRSVDVRKIVIILILNTIKTKNLSQRLRFCYDRKENYAPFKALIFSVKAGMIWNASPTTP